MKNSPRPPRRKSDSASAKPKPRKPNSKRPDHSKPRGEGDRDERPKRPFTPKSEEGRSSFKRSERPDGERSERPKRPFTPKSEEGRSSFKRSERPDGERSERPKRPFAPKSEEGRSDFKRSERPDGERSERPKRPFAPKSEEGRSDFKRAERRPDSERSERPKRPFAPKSDEGKRDFKKSERTDSRGGGSRKTPSVKGKKKEFLGEKSVFRPKIDKLNPVEDDDMRLNKYVALCGVAARRKAGDMILAGEVTVNDVVITEPGHRVLMTDVVRHQGAILKPNERKIYLLMNKPKDTLTTVTDDRGRKTVMDLISRTVKERIFPVGRLDRDTTGLLMLTNDGDLAQKLSHPSYRIKKFYQVQLNKALTKNDLETISKGIELEDGIAEVDAINYLEGAKKDELMVEIHIGKNRIVRRIFEHFGYEVIKLDRVYYGGLTKKDLPRGEYRTLTDREVIMLKHFTGK